MKQRLFCLLTLLMLLACPLARADFGDFSGGSDYGSDSFDFSSSSSYDFDSSSDSRSSSTHENNDPLRGSNFLTVVVLLVICAGAALLKLNESFYGVPRSHLDDRVRDTAGLADEQRSHHYQPISQLKNFDAEDITEKIPGMYRHLQSAWTAGNLKPIEPLLTAPYYAEMEKQLKQDFLDKGITSHMEYIAVISVSLLGCLPGKADTPDRLYVSLWTRFVNYLTNSDGKIIRGDPKDEIYMHYEWTMERQSTPLPDEEQPEWVISRISGLSRKTVDADRLKGGYL